MLRPEAVHEQVVDEGAGGCEQARVLRLANLQLCGIVARDALHRVECVVAGNLDLPHVTDIEQSGTLAHGHVFGGDAGVFDRHIPAAERNHPGAEGAMAGVERRLLQRGIGGLIHGEM